MSENIKHECGIAMLRLRKPIEYYREKYGDSLYGLGKMYVLMEKQHNRGQDGAGMACIKFGMPPGTTYTDVVRSNSATPIKEIFQQTYAQIESLVGSDKSRYADMDWVKNNLPFSGELFLGHLRYGTFGKNDIRNIHPFVRQSNWKTRNLIIAGNFNLTNIDELFDDLVNSGQHPVMLGDTITVLEKLAKFLDHENQRLYDQYKQAGHSKVEISAIMPQALDLKEIVRKVAQDWDGGFVFGGMVGYGDAFVIRDAKGIRPAFYYMDDEVLVVASERPVIQTVFNVPFEQVKELPAGHIILSHYNGEVDITPCLKPAGELSPCSFEHIYFSRGTDAEIYRERKRLGALLVPDVLKEIKYDLENTVFTSIPNTAQVAYTGMREGVYDYNERQKIEKVMALGASPKREDLEKVLLFSPRMEQIVVKDAKMRTFITGDDQRKNLVNHIYDVTYGQVREFRDTLVAIDDSIVRGTTLRESILRMLDRLCPKKIVIVSSAPQIRYPDCYGIDMAKLGDFIAFQATVSLLKEQGREDILADTYRKCKEQLEKPRNEAVNHVKAVYAPFTDAQISEKIAQMLRTDAIKAEVAVIYQSVENLHKACPNSHGDWYFTGNYPTPGGNAVACRAFVNYMENKNTRAY
ncbi:MAG: class II glutamine amidotransferase [Lentimicrobiaceae bacterium]|nr:class II glutamine amidotransferase [Lentimicrobiaceae bacterium]